MRGDEHVPQVERLVELRGIGTEPGRNHVEHLNARRGQFGPHDPGDRAADHARDDREDQVERADILVVRRHEPPGEEARLVVGIVMMLVRMGLEGVSSGSHVALVLFGST